MTEETRIYPRTGVTSGEYTCLITREEWESQPAARASGEFFLQKNGKCGMIWTGNQSGTRPLPK